MNLKCGMWIDKCFIYLAFICLPLICFSQQHPWLEEALNQPAFKQAHLGIAVKNITKGQEIISWNADDYFIPASTLKMKTVIDALNVLGGDHRFESRVMIVGEIDNGVLYGDIVLKGKGDPTLHSELSGSVTMDDIVADILQALRRLKVTCVMGQVITDASFISLPGIPTGYFYDDVANYYGAGVFGWNVAENKFPVVFHRNKNGHVAIKQFDTLAVDFIQSDVIAKGRSDRAYAFPHPDPNGLFVKGSIPAGAGDFSIKAAIPNPPLYSAKWVQQALEYSGVEMHHAPRALWYPYAFQSDIIWQKTYHSPELADLLVPVLHKSNNVFAESIFRYVTKENTGTKEDRLFDGSGLSSTNRIQPIEMMQILEQGLNQCGQKLLSAMARNGRDGTVKSVLRDNPAKLLIKSGYINYVRCYVGYHKAKNGDWIGFVCFANNLTANPTASRRAWEDLLRHIAAM